MRYLIVYIFICIMLIKKYHLRKILTVKKAAQGSDFQISITHHQMALDSRKYHHSTQNQKIHRTVSLIFFSKKSNSQLCFHFTINY